MDAFGILCLYGRRTASEINTFPITDVRLISGPFKHAESMDICYLLGLDPDRLLAPYMKEAGLQPKAENYPNWENTGLDGHIGGHYLSALSYMYASTGDEEIGKRLDYFLSEMKRCQEASGNGYLCGVPNGKAIWNEIKNGKSMPILSGSIIDGYLYIISIKRMRVCAMPM